MLPAHAIDDEGKVGDDGGDVGGGWRHERRKSAAM
jgi:hypothetical protein